MTGDSNSTPSQASAAAKTEKGGDKLRDAWHKYQGELNISQCLEGKPLGHLLLNAQRAIGPLRKAHPGAPEVLLLQGHIDLFKKAEQLKPSVLARVSKAERSAIMEEFGELQRALSSTQPDGHSGSQDEGRD